ncbi:hypothetical protein CHLRE_03g182100v5 [Chlamydomonas reinhardtii]|uniref:Uncharacterized protein n=1 Tax=Chlamydomonas reinhardtii TaxID=3055 RepID=A0A2K3DXV5_CHLRE|nr:uncharacterized protein CHLRE_03g182100v5 [Chlamydomonas reinhardtii]PNW85347.1 hypothetical protein CHLRE_03g182100v5 [Chlamydomonas reinhardtii]
MDASVAHGPFIRGLVFSGALLHGCEALRNQLQLLLWGGLRVAELRSPDQTSEPGAVPSGVDILQLSDSNTWEPVLKAWAEGHGLQLPGEVVVLASGAGDAEVLPGFTANAGQDAPWPRLRLALAHANLLRAATLGSAGASGTSGRKRAREEVEEDVGPAAVADSAASAGSSGTARGSELVVVGYAMKASREADLAKEGLLNLVPQDGVVFAPLDLSQPLESQLPFHCILHKASDELEYGPPSPPAAAAAAGESAVPTAGRGVGGEGAASASSTGDDGGASGGGAGLLVPRFGPRVRAMAEFVSQQGGRVSLLDPLQSTAKVINRTELGRVCDSLSQVALQGAVGGAGVVVRAPRNVTIASYEPQQLEAALKQLGCSAPFIVKPVVACGTPDSHAMALALWPQALGGLAGRVPLPAVVQEFVNHDATIYKVYVAGNKVFHTVRPSIPNVPHTRPAAEALVASGVLTFDSLKSLPTKLPSDASPAASAASAAVPAAAAAAAPAATSFTPSQEVLELLAAHLRAALGLSLFGFDVVVRTVEEDEEQKEATEPHAAKPRELVVVDVNYFPSYRGAKGAPALFRTAVLGAHRAQVPG